MSKPTIYLVGDAILDNFSWLSDKTKDLTAELINHDYKVINYAADNTSVHNVVHGVIPERRYRDLRTYPYPIGKDGKMYPMKQTIHDLLASEARSVESKESHRSLVGVYGDILPIERTEKSKEKSKKRNDMIVLSMGGNDIRHQQNSFSSMSVLFGIENFVNKIITKEFTREYESIVDQLLQHCSKIVLVSIYLPYLGEGSSYRRYSRYAEYMTSHWLQFMKDVAKKYDIPILDLNRTLDINNRAHYGTLESHPSNISNKCMADCLSYIHCHYQGYGIYYAPKCDISKIVIEF